MWRLAAEAHAQGAARRGVRAWRREAESMRAQAARRARAEGHGARWERRRAVRRWRAWRAAACFQAGSGLEPEQLARRGRHCDARRALLALGEHAARALRP